MKINFKHVAVFLVLIAIAATSCSSNSDSEPEPLPAFFNLNVGNEWVYKEYKNSEENQSEYNFTGKIDSVEVESVIAIEGVEFSKLRHKVGNQIRYEYLRVDEFGHLVGNTYFLTAADDPAGTGVKLNHVKHPGDDITYQNTLVQESGTTFASVFPNSNIIVEGNNYTVSPLVLEYTSPEGTVPMINKSVESNYQRQIGLVKKTNAYVFGNVFWEDRLVSYHIVN